VKRLVLLLTLLTVGVAPALAQQPINLTLSLEPMWNQIHAQPGDFGVACMPLDRPGRLTLYHADDAFPMASVAKLLIFLEYARQVDVGRIGLDELVPVEILNSYDLPGTNRGAHDQFLALYPAETTTLSLYDVAATGMLQYSSNAAADYLLDRLGAVNWDDLFGLLGLHDTDPPHAMSAVALLMNNHDTGQPRLAEVPALTLAQGEALFDRYLSDPAWRAVELEYRTARRRSFPNWDVQAAILDELSAHSTARDLLKVLAAIYRSPSKLPDPVQRMTRAALQFRGYTLIDGLYIEYGSKLGSYSGGLLALAAYGYPLNGEPVISVTFLRNIPRADYNHLLRDDSIGYFAHWLNLNACAGLLEGINSLG